MPCRSIVSLVLAAALAGCGRHSWPEPPPADQAKYEQSYKEWREEQQRTALASTKVIGIWPLEEGETPFGADASLPVVFPAKASPNRAGAFRRSGANVSVIPASGVTLRTANGADVKGLSEVQDELTLGSLRLQVIDMGDGRRFLMASDEDHPALKNFPMVDVYPVHERWRIAARFDAFDTPHPIRIADVRGGFSEQMAAGRLTFEVDGQEQHLIAITFPGSDEFFVMFKDATNSTTTYGSRMLAPRAVANGQFTVLDFNLARNPPCAYSRYTTCPLPPAENRLTVAIEAGEKRFPLDQGFSLE
jgi:uncharacterized protein (DUF1684 family)